MIDKLQVRVLGGDEEAVVICAKRRALSYDTQLVARAHIVNLGDDLTRMIFGKLLLRDCVAVSHVCAYWRWLAVTDPLLWTVLAGSPARIPLLYERAGSTIPVDVRLGFRRDALVHIVSCISENFCRMKSFTLIAEDGDCVPEAVWMTVLGMLSRPGQLLQRLYLEHGCWKSPTFTLAATGSTSRLCELVLLGILMPDLSLLPPALISLAYGGPTCETRIVFTFRDLRTIFRTCPALKNLWLCVDWRGSAAELHNTAPTTVQLHQLRLRILSNATVMQYLLSFMTCRSIRHVDVCHFEDDPVYDLLPNFQGHCISILPTTMGWDREDCDIVVTDSSERSRYIRGAYFEHIRTYPRLWSSLVSLTICGDMSNRLQRPPPHAPCLQYLRLLYHPISDRRAIRRTISAIEPWRLANGEWQCPNLHTVEFALVLTRSLDRRLQEIVRPLLLPSSAVLRFVTGELSHSPVTRVIVKGDNIRIQSDADEELPFALSCDTSDSTIQVLWVDFAFDGFDSEH